jgi:hypothetical protein
MTSVTGLLIYDSSKILLYLECLFMEYGSFLNMALEMCLILE